MSLFTFSVEAQAPEIDLSATLYESPSIYKLEATVSTETDADCYISIINEAADVYLFSASEVFEGEQDVIVFFHGVAGEYEFSVEAENDFGTEEESDGFDISSSSDCDEYNFPDREEDRAFIGTYSSESTEELLVDTDPESEGVSRTMIKNLTGGVVNFDYSVGPYITDEDEDDDAYVAGSHWLNPGEKLIIFYVGPTGVYELRIDITAGGDGVESEIFALKSAVECVDPMFDFVFEPNIDVESCDLVQIEWEIDGRFCEGVHKIKNMDGGGTLVSMPIVGGVVDYDFDPTAYGYPDGGNFRSIVQMVNSDHSEIDYEDFTVSCEMMRHTGADNGLKIFPNPTDGIVNIESNDAAQVEIENLSGGVVAQYDISTSKAFSVSDLPAGLYIVKTYDLSGELTGKTKLIKQ